MPGGESSKLSSRWRRLSAEDLAWLGLLPAAIITLAAVKWLAPALDGPLAPPGDYYAFTGLGDLFAPEPLEEARFLIAIAAPVLLACLVSILGSNRSDERRLDPLFVILQALVLGFVLWALTQQETDLPLFPGVIAAYDWLPRYMVGAPVLVAGLAIGIGLTFLLFRNPRIGGRPQALAQRLASVRRLPATIALIASVLWLLPGIVTDANIRETGFAYGHIPLHFEDYAAVVNGRTPLVDYVAWYSSLLPLAFAPVLGLFNSSVTSFSLIEVGLSVAAVICVYGAFVHLTLSRWAALALFLPFLAITFIPWHFESNGVRIFSGIYYALFPSRFLGPLVLFWLLARRLRRGSPPAAVVYFVAGLAVLNNFEFGACALVALIAASLAELDRAQPVGPRIGDLLLQAAVGLLGALVLVSAVTLVRAGALPDLSVLTYWSHLFGREGFNLLPMPLWGFQWALYFTYAGALLTGVVRLIRHPEDRVLSPLLVFAGVFGLTTGQYFAGRSEATQLIGLLSVWGLNLALLTWLIAGTLRGVSVSRARRQLVPALAVLAGFGVMIASLARVPAPWHEIDRIFHGGPHILDGTAEQRFVRAHTTPGERILLVNTLLDHRVAEWTGVENVSPWSTNAFYSPSEVDRALDNLDDEGGTKIFERYRAMGSPQAGQIEQILRESGFRLVTTDPLTKLNLWVRTGTT